MILFLILLSIISVFFTASSENFNTVRYPAIEGNTNDHISLSPFSFKFLVYVQDSAELFKIFSLGIEDSRNYSILYKILHDGGVEINSSNPDEFAKTIADSFSSVLDIMTPTIWGKALSTAIERLLNYFGVNTIVKAQEYAEQMARNIENAGNKIESNPHPGDYFKAVVQGAAELVNSLTTVTPKAAQLFSNYLSEEFYALK